MHEWICPEHTNAVAEDDRIVCRIRLRGTTPPAALRPKAAGCNAAGVDRNAYRVEPTCA
jgi:hypothetical protein